MPDRLKGIFGVIASIFLSGAGGLLHNIPGLEPIAALMIVVGIFLFIVSMAAMIRNP